MYQLLALLTGVILSIMISINGHLTSLYGVFLATVIIHIVGSSAAFILCALQKEKKPLFVHHPKWIYLGGAIGVFTTVFNNFAFGHISVTSIIALGLLGQAIISLIIDTFGLFGMDKQSFDKKAIPGLIMSFLGMFIMLDRSVSSAIIAVFLSFCAGISIVLSRTVNARLAKQIGALRGSLVNHLVGLPFTIIIALLAGEISALTTNHLTFQPWIYFGGILGVAVVLLSNLAVPKLSAYHLTILTFVGQVFTGIILDFALGQTVSNISFVAGIIIAFGLAINLIIEKNYSSKK